MSHDLKIHFTKLGDKYVYCGLLKRGKRLAFKPGDVTCGNCITFMYERNRVLGKDRFKDISKVKTK